MRTPTILYLASLLLVPVAVFSTNIGLSSTAFLVQLSLLFTGILADLGFLPPFLD